LLSNHARTTQRRKKNGRRIGEVQLGSAIASFLEFFLALTRYKHLEMPKRREISAPGISKLKSLINKWL